MNKHHTFIDLFAGCSGLSLGAAKAGFIGKLAIEYQENAFNTLQYNLINSKRDKIRSKSNVLNFN